MAAFASYYGQRMPTGPWMVVAVSTIFLLSLLIAPKRGALPRWWRLRRFRLRTAEENLLRSLYRAGEADAAWHTAYALPELLQQRVMPIATLRHTLQRLVRQGLVQQVPGLRFALSPAGLDAARDVTRRHRLWEVYLTRQLEIAPDHVHDDAEEIEHILTPELEQQILDLLGHPETDPHGQVIPGLPATETRP